jgi:hypothetical protein
MKSLPTLLLASLVACALSACGGGGDDQNQDLQQVLEGGHPPQDAQACPTSTQSDVWLDKRLGCLSAGAQFTDLSAGYGGGDTQDTSYTVNELAQDTAFNDILDDGKTRYWANFLCVRHAPVQADSGFGLGLAGDLQIAMGISNFGKFKPQGIGAVSIGLSSGGEAGVTGRKAEPCDPARHPVIVDYATGRIESVNPGALAAMTVYDLAH